eukprot:TRINITY_DN1079_c0_g1_i1.p1 TRINITY_DN1079_c0_g1~~TRINITY_DN1079_c0_g1_i1.p1  ORF type:complete len:264 (-),score=1.29 TRINITY_DN1079_c0_g1_i1:280-1071(-)
MKPTRLFFSSCLNHKHRLQATSVRFLRTFQSKVLQTTRFSASSIFQRLKSLRPFTPNKRNYYTYNSGRTIFGISPTVFALLSANLGVFLAWRWYISGNDHRGIQWMFRNFTSSPQNGPHTLITSIFSHNGFGHFFFNMFGLWSFGSTMCYLLSPSRFLLLYLGGGIVGNLYQLYRAKSERRNVYGLGASGAVYSLLINYALNFPRSQIILFFFPLPAMVAVPGLLLFDYYYLGSKSSTTGHAAHLGGAMWGAAFFLGSMLRRR